MNTEFNWWLLIVGLVVGGALVWFVLMDVRRREADIDAVEGPREAAWLSAVLRDEGHDVSPIAAARLLELHRRYLEAPAPDDPVRPLPAETGPPLVAESGSQLPEDDGLGVERAGVDVHERHTEGDIVR